MNQQLPISLYKANAELQLEITRLMQACSHQWIEAMQRLSTEGLRETTSRIEGVQQAADWQAMASLPSDVFWRLFQGRLSDTQAVNEAMIRNQTVFSDGLRQAIVNWQKKVAEALGAGADPATLARLSQQSVWPWQPPVSDSADKGKKSG